ncbi:hypothetical protein [Pseudolactococcus insecticola]|uniref:Uncharacterized protein n=1 Tax=Pseudolactococcus insecticola TaxID=2709158 RepID=A0A6A0B526_9LACT|nr:hypothetical protein [Lactococcus insecticola]GFH39621.1 hypothetical protein Hs20B_00190 [Lactococcus insecticola]
MRQSLQRRWEMDAEMYELDMDDPDSVARYLGFENEADQKAYDDFEEKEFWVRLPNGKKTFNPAYGNISPVKAWKQYKKEHNLKF